MTNLVKIEGKKHTFYKGKDKVLAVESGDIDKGMLEHYRKDHNSLLTDAGVITKPKVMIEVSKDEYEQLQTEHKFLSDLVLKGMTQEEWLAVNYESEPA